MTTLANAVAGVLVGLDLDRRPALVRQNDSLSGGVALPVPTHCKFIVATMSVDKFGQTAVIYAATMFVHPELLIIDFDVGPLHGSLFGKVGNRVRELSDACRARGSIVFVPESLLPHARATGLMCELAPPDIEPEELYYRRAIIPALVGLKCVHRLLRSHGRRRLRAR